MRALRHLDHHLTRVLRRETQRLSILALSVIAMAAVVPTTASATISNNPYALSTGYDVSYPNCNSGTPSTTLSFAIIGLGGGRPFTLNSCASSEWDSALKLNESLYFNTGYAGAYAKSIDSTCTGYITTDPTVSTLFSNMSRHQASQAEQAWEIGCSEALYAISKSPGAPTMWWADIETGNSWSTNVTLNQFAIDGLSYEMNTTTVGGGFYSSPAMWASITGPTVFTPSPAPPAVWNAAGQCDPSTTTTSYNFAGVPTWLYQSGTVSTSSGSVDQDFGC